MPFQSPLTRRLAPLTLDVTLVVLFAALGARTHHDGPLTIAAVADVAWPFLVSLGAIHALGRRPWSVAFGFAAWLGTVGGGMAIRQFTGDGTALAFVVVATCFILATVVGWRLIAALVVRRRVTDA